MLKGLLKGSFYRGTSNFGLLKYPHMKSAVRNFLLILIICAPSILFAQTDSTEMPAKPKKSITDRMFIGGSLALTFGDITYVGASPLVGYRFTPALTGGVGISYYYYKDNIYNYETSIYGGTLFSRYLIFKGLFAEADFEANNLDAMTIVDPINGTYTLSRQWIPSLLLGGGYYSGGDNVGFYISVLYDVLQDPNSPYYGFPVIRAGVGVGL